MDGGHSSFSPTAEWFPRLCFSWPWMRKLFTPTSAPISFCSEFGLLCLLTYRRKRYYILKMFCLLENIQDPYMAFGILSPSSVSCVFDCYELATKAWPNQAFALKPRALLSQKEMISTKVVVGPIVFCLILSNPTGVLWGTLFLRVAHSLDTLAKSPLWNHCGFDFRGLGYWYFLQ